VARGPRGDAGRAGRRLHQHRYIPSKTLRQAVVELSSASQREDGGSLAPEPGLFPYGVYTVPEISMVVRTEAELTEAGVPYEVETAHYREIARGQIVCDLSGLMKHLVHIIGKDTPELVHIGQAVMALGATIEYFVKTVFNYPTFADCYKTAAFDALNRMAEVEGFDLRSPTPSAPTRWSRAPSAPSLTHCRLTGRGVHRR
jgi:hypothetical protein